MSNNQFRCLIILTMLYIGLGFSSVLVVYRPVLLGSTIASAGSLVSSLWFVLSDIIAELYGYKASKNMLYAMFLVCFACACLLFLLIHLPSPESWHGQSAYQAILAPLPKILASSFVGFLISGFVNIRLLTQWKIMLHGRYFWLRSFGASTLGEVIFTGIASFFILYGTALQGELISVICWGVVLKMAVNIILVFPASILVSLLKKTNFADVFEIKNYPNPFIKK